jgi:hypothetical protein
MRGDFQPPTPGKRGFNFPLPPEALDHFRHPGGIRCFESAGIDSEGRVIVANGFVALRISSFMPDQEPATERLIERVESLPWSRFDSIEDRAEGWRSLDDVRGSLYRFPPRPIWEPGTRAWHFRRQPAVGIGAATVCQFATLQLIARLPRPEVWTLGEFRHPVFFRFNGGQGIIPHFDGLEIPSFRLFQKSTKAQLRGGLL